ncbi:MAG TPA: type II toxin-antitoxin system HicB family antitoxin [Candidatus Hydrogenedentes bacterium]|nr:type II toxin-antitoxin system HicB family antitoxin [Candidatus Hydrogenedentota bacterium]HNT86828.1 type II toxin-antitoxin system HicB family antitoxin [Candidatus Hydrogenedentota bacterium]
MSIEVEQETDGRWIAEAVDFPGAMAYGATQADTVRTVARLVEGIVAERSEHDEDSPGAPHQAGVS